MSLYEKGCEIASQNGLILVDTKYEFGEDEDGNIVLMDEMHTPDSSRFWYQDEYHKHFKASEEQNQLSKEHLRSWLIEQGFSGDGKPPVLTDDIKVETAKKYIEVYEKITGLKFKPQPGDVSLRIKSNLKNWI